MERLLVDECLSPSLVRIAKQHGYDATHVGFIGRSGAPDHRLIELIVAGSYVFVTQNARDFRRLYASLPIHNGLVILIPKVRAAVRQTLFSAALAAIEPLDHTINVVVEVRAADDIEIWTMGGSSR